MVKLAKSRKKILFRVFISLVSGNSVGFCGYQSNQDFIENLSRSQWLIQRSHEHKKTTPMKGVGIHCS